MHLLIRVEEQTGHAAHIPDMNGEPLCKTRLNRAVWQICECQPGGTVICYHCRRARSAKECVAWKDRSSISEPQQ
jgi:hypothetical protein